MRKLLLYLFFLLPVVGFSQAGEFAGTVVVLSSSGTDPNFTVATSFNSTLGFTASQAIVGDIVIARYVSGVNNYRNLYEVTSVSASGSNLTLGLMRLTGVSTSFFPSGTHAIVRKTDAGLLYDAPNVSQEIESYTTNYNLGLIDGFKVDTLTVSSDTITLSLEDGTEFVAVIPVRPLLDTCYSVSISGANAGSVLYVCANGGGVTASFSSGELTVVSTATSRVKSAYWKLVAADVQSGADAGGVADWVRVKFTGTRGNTGLTDIRVPTIGKTALPSGTLALNNAASYDIDSNPAVSVVECASNSITIRVGGVSATNGYQLSFTGVH